MNDLQLASWLHAVSLEPGSTRQGAIGEAAKALAAAAKAPDVAGYALLAYGQPAEEQFESIRAAVSSQDSTFGCAMDDLESRLIAAVCVAEALSRNAGIAIVAAHCVLSARWIGLECVVADLPTLATETLAQRAEAARTRTSLTVATDLSAALKQMPELPSDGAPVSHQDGRAIEAGVSAGLEVLKKAIDGLTRAVGTRLRASDEELDLLWWAMSNYSERLAKVWKQVTNEGLAALATALEFADLVQFPVEPSSTSALLARVLGSRADHEVSLASAVTAAGKEGLAARLDNGHQLLPVLSSLSEYDALEGKTAWKGSVARWRIDPELLTTCLGLAEQCVRERLLSQQLI